MQSQTLSIASHRFAPAHFAITSFRCTGKGETMRAYTSQGVPRVSSTARCIYSLRCKAAPLGTHNKTTGSLSSAWIAPPFQVFTPAKPRNYRHWHAHGVRTPIASPLRCLQKQISFKMMIALPWSKRRAARTSSSGPVKRGGKEGEGALAQCCVHDAIAR